MLRGDDAKYYMYSQTEDIIVISDNIEKAMWVDFICVVLYLIIFVLFLMVER